MTDDQVEVMERLCAAVQMEATDGDESAYDLRVQTAFMIGMGVGLEHAEFAGIALKALEGEATEGRWKQTANEAVTFAMTGSTNSQGGQS